MTSESIKNLSTIEIRGYCCIVLDIMRNSRLDLLNQQNLDSKVATETLTTANLTAVCQLDVYQRRTSNHRTMFITACSSACTWCRERFYQRPNVFMQVFWSTMDLVGTMHHGVEWCSPLSTALVAIGIWYIFHPG